ncbi:maleylpyruvate isomerase N-terminal domain-containing protein [Streptomyces coeruleorubidus]|uniref:maleylpyruvate isomerase N-terminal domain-containing protein n=1 Tax=Streptomyces coeruleorubidus TaxID=116188 RepID=UPI00187724DB|nr:DinB family protein [Streptomyces bellus]GGU21527.1 hypothetical protein GCM10010244_55100 [Streptomyces bellus]
MSNRLPAADPPNMVAALRAERAEMLDFTGSLTDDEWTAPSTACGQGAAVRRQVPRCAAAGWRIADVVAHIGATARSFYTPAGLRTIFAASLEQVNEDPVGRRRDRSRADVMAEYQRASRRATALLDAVRRTPATRVRVRLAELGRYPMGLMMAHWSSTITRTCALPRRPDSHRPRRRDLVVRRGRRPGSVQPRSPRTSPPPR